MPSESPKTQVNLKSRAPGDLAHVCGTRGSVCVIFSFSETIFPYFCAQLPAHLFNILIEPSESLFQNGPEFASYLLSKQ